MVHPHHRRNLYSKLGLPLSKIALSLLPLGFACSAIASDELTFVESIIDGSNLSHVSDPAVSQDGQYVYSAVWFLNSITVYKRDISTGELSFVERIEDSDNLSQVFGVDVSPDDKHVYASAVVKGITTYSRDTDTGQLTFVESNTSATPDGFISVAVSDDGVSVYALSACGTNELAVFQRDSNTGKLTLLEEHVDGVDGNLLGQKCSEYTSPINNIAISDAGNFLYVTSTSDNAISVYARNTQNGSLILSSTVVDGVNGVDGIQGSSSLALSSDNKYLFANGQSESSVAVFAVDSDTGALTFIEKKTDETDGITSLGGARSLAVSPDGRYLYVSAYTDNSITVFGIDSSSGSLTYLMSAQDDDGLVDGLQGVSGMEADPLSRHLYAAGMKENSIVVFSLPIPAITLSNTTASATEKGDSVVLDNALTLYDSDDTHLASATINFGSGFNTNDSLSVTTQAGVSVSYDSAQGILTLSGSATLEDYQAILRTLTFEAGNDDSIGDGETASREVNLQVSDGTNLSAEVTILVTVNGVSTVTNTAPTISGAPSTSVAQGSAYSFTPIASDVDTGDSLTFSITNKPSWASFNTSTGALTGTPTNDDVGTTSNIVISVSDGTASASLSAFSLQVTNVNDAPTISGAPSTSVAQGSAYSFTPIASDVDTGDSLTFSITNKPSWASFNTSTGALTGTPTNDDVGTTSNIVISVSDGTASASLSAFSLQVTNVNDAPTISGAPSTSVAQGSAYSFTPTASDVDTGDSLTFSITNKPSWASFNTSTGALTGTPTNDDVGTTSNIVISVSDGTASASLSAFSLQVTNVNDAPTISGAPSTSVAQGSAYSFTPTASDVDTGDSLTFSITNKPSWASFNTSTGALTGTPTNDDVGTTSNIVISVSDGTASASLSAFSLQVTNVNDAPTISGAPSTSVAQGSAYSFTPTASDVDTGDSLTFSITNKPSWASFNTSTGALTGTPTNDDVGTTSNIVISVSDGTASASLSAFSLQVTNVNDAPTISGAPSTSVAQGSAYSFTPTASDVDTGDSLTFSITNKPSWASFNTSTGALTGTPTNDDVGTTSNIVISVSDGTASASLSAFSLQVTNVNDAPTISGAPSTSVAQGSAYSFTPTASDVDTGDSLTFSITNKPSWASFNTSTGALTGTPTNDDVGTTSNIVISVSDGTASASLSAFSLQVTNVNDAPTISGAPSTSVAQGSAYSFTPTASDVDTGDSLTFSITNKPSWASFNTSTGALTGTPTNDDVGTTSNIVISVSDGTASASLSAFSLQVTNVNDAPTISGAPSTSVAQGSAYSFTPIASDVDTGDSLTFSITNKPSWASFNTSTGALTGTPTNDDVGTTSNIVISVSDGTASASLSAFSLQVTNVNDAPTISGAPSTSVAQGSAYSFTPTASDVDTGDSLTFSITNKPSWASFNTSTGALTGTPTNDDVGTTSNIVISVSDGTASASLSAFSLQVTNVNDAPTISGAPSTSVAQGSAYSFTPTASDVDTGDSLTFGITNKPTWASFNTATGALTGTPTNDDVGTVSNIVISVSDGTASDSLAAFNVTVSNVNDAPTISGTPSTSVAQDSTYSFTPTASDVDTGDSLTFSITNKPTWASFNTSTGALTGTPTNDDVGTTSGIVITVSDGSASASLNSFSVEVTNVNDVPVAVDDSFTFTVTSSDTYTLDVLSNDTDVDQDTLALDWVTTDIGTATITDDQITLVTDIVGTVTLKYGVSDGNGGSDTGRATVVISADTSVAPEITPPADVEVNATALFTKVNLGVATAVDSTGKSLAVTVDQDTFFEPGEHTVYWSTEDANGNKASASQQVIVHPLVSISKDRVVAEGESYTVKVLLNGESPVYPLVIPYTVTGTSDSSDHDLVDGSVTIASGTEGSIPFNVIDDGVGEGNETLIINLSDSVNLGAKSSSVVTISEDNIAPEVTVMISQNGESRSKVDTTSGDVTISTSVTDANVSDTHTYQWVNDNADLANISSDSTAFKFDPSALDEGVYRLQLVVTDSGSASVTKNIYISVIAQLETLDSSDSDGDLIPDNQEGFADSDDDGIPDYQDAISECNVIQEQALESSSYLVEGDPGVCLRKGITLANNQTGGTQLLAGEVDSDSFDNIGGIFDFVAYDLPTIGQTYQIVFPQRLPIPADAVYRKYLSGSWGDFVIDSNNYVSSAAGQSGYCPPPGDSSWTSGLTEGDWCVQLTIEDGGPNDDDGIANGSIVDPGGVATTAANTAPVVTDDTVFVAPGSSVEINVLDNDSDADGDILSISAASASFGSVTIGSGATVLIYTAPDGYYGTDTISYSITDGNGGTAAGQVTVNVTESAGGIVHNSAGGGSLGGIALMMLSGLALTRRHGRKLLAALLALLSFNSQANWYIDADIGISDAENRMEVSDDSVVDVDQTDTMWSMGLGYKFNPQWSVAGHYLDLGQGSSTLNPDVSTNPSDYHQTVAKVTPALAEGLTLSVSYGFIQRENYTLNATLGSFFWKVDFDSEYQGTHIRSTEYGTDPYIGIGAVHKLNNKWNFGWELDQYFIDLNDVTTISAKLTYQFE